MIWCDLYQRFYGTFGCCYNVVQYKMILHTSLQWQKLNMYQFKFIKDTPYLTLMGKLWGVHCSELEKFDPAINVPYCTSLLSKLWPVFIINPNHMLVLLVMISIFLPKSGTCRLIFRLLRARLQYLSALLQCCTKALIWSCLRQKRC